MIPLALDLLDRLVGLPLLASSQRHVGQCDCLLLSPSLLHSPHSRGVERLYPLEDVFAAGRRAGAPVHLGVVESALLRERAVHVEDDRLEARCWATR